MIDPGRPHFLLHACSLLHRVGNCSWISSRKARIFKAHANHLAGNFDLNPSHDLSLLALYTLRLLLPSLSDPLQYVFPVLVKLQLRDNNFARVDSNRDALPIGFLTRYTLDMDDVFEAVDGGYGAISAFVGAANNSHFVVFADWD